MTQQSKKKTGRVCLIGAGPGDPGLITHKGLQRLQRAEVLVFDALAAPALVDMAPSTAERLDVGKRGGDHKKTQDQINELLLEKAKEGHFVVRLKGGDPYLFGRGAEEVAYLARGGVSCEVVPGVTSGIAAPAMAGIPITHRQCASAVTFVTGHEDPTKEESSLDYQSLAGLVKSGGTVCFYMGVGRLAAIRDALCGYGAQEQTPVALVQWGTLPKQRSVRGTLANIVDEVAAAGISSPAIIVVGQAAGLTEPGLDFFTARPLFGQTIVITRTRQQTSELGVQLEELGARVIEAPTIELVPPKDWSQVDEALGRIASYDWLVLTSVNGVTAVAQRLAALGLDGRSLAGVKIAAIGDATANAVWEELKLNADLVPTRYVAESLAGELIAKHDVAGKRFLLLRADIARPQLPEMLAQAGAEVEELVAYETQTVKALPDAVIDELSEQNVDWVTFTSASTVRNMAALLGYKSDLLQHARLASIGPITSQAMRELGLDIAIEAEQSNVAGLVEAVTNATQ